MLTTSPNGEAHLTFGVGSPSAVHASTTSEPAGTFRLGVEDWITGPEQAKSDTERSSSGPGVPGPRQRRDRPPPGCREASAGDPNHRRSQANSQLQ